MIMLSVSVYAMSKCFLDQRGALAKMIELSQNLLSWCSTIVIFYMMYVNKDIILHEKMDSSLKSMVFMGDAMYLATFSIRLMILRGIGVPLLTMNVDVFSPTSAAESVFGALNGSKKRVIKHGKLQ
jgi:hypothetical protein